MRCSIVVLSGLLGIGIVGCSDDSPTQSVGGALAPGGAGGTPTAAGSSGASASGTASAAGGSSNSGGSPSEAPNVGAPLDPSASAGASSSEGEGAPGGAGTAPDAGTTPSGAGPCPPGPFADNPLPAGATAQAVCTGMTFTEGAVWFQGLNTLFFSDFSINSAATNFDGPIMAFTPGGECEPFIPNAGTNGLVIAPDGNLLGARHSDQTLTIFDLDSREPTVLVPDFDGVSFNSPNDIAVRSDGNMYFTDPTYLLGNRTSEAPARAYRRDPDGALSVIDEGGNANGITLSPDETRLYLAHLGGGNDIVVFDVDASGALGDAEPFANVGSDGMAIDCAGNLYTTTQGSVRVFSPNGDQIGTLPAQGAANVAFGGPERRTLFITAGTQLLAVELAIPGLPY